MALSRKRPYADAEAQPESHHHFRKRANTSPYGYHHSGHVGEPPTSIAVDPTHDAYNTTATSSSADLNQLLLPGHGFEGPGLPRPAYPSQINDLEPLTQDTQSASVGHHEPEPNPSLNSNPGPWNPQCVNGGPFQHPMSRAYSGTWGRANYPYARPHGWPPTSSEMDCSVSGRYPPDSAYYTKSPATQSMLSGEFPPSSQQSLTGAMNAMEFPNEPPPYMFYQRVSQDVQSSFAERSFAEHQTDDLLCEKCETPQTFKNKSEFHKHTLRHDKPYKCDVAGCTRKTGFTTKNDLDRHKKSIHQIYTGKSYMCAAPHCAKKNKIWPRADNFRQHIIRLHNDWEVQELMDKSWERGCSMTQGNSRRGFVQSLELCQQSIYEDDGPTEYDMSYLVNPQEIDKSSSVDSISNPYQHETGHSSATSQGSSNLYSPSSQDVTDLMDLDREAINPYQTVVIPDDQLDPSIPESSIAISKSSPPCKANQPLIHQPNDHSESSALTYREKLRTTSTGGLQPLAFSADEASQAIASALFNKSSHQSKEEMELVIKTRFLTLLSANKSQQTNPQDSPCREVNDGEKQLECQYCHKKKKTQCDLTKHIKRHTRPYGCTFTKCPRRFGSKNDWKRHENTMHYQVEAWKCAELKLADCTAIGADKMTTSATTKQCGRLWYRRELFISHLHEAHNLVGPDKEDYVKEQCKKRRVGRNGQCGFWCGFCQTVVRLEKDGIEAWDERFNHIDDEHFKRGGRVEDWVPLEGEVPMGVMMTTTAMTMASSSSAVGTASGDPEREAKEADDRGSDEDDSGEDVVDAVEGDVDVVVLEKGGWEERTARDKATAVAVAKSKGPSSSGYDGRNGNNRNVGALGSEGREGMRRLWDCCKCGNGELSRDTDLMCYSPECNHVRCDRCKVQDRRERKVGMVGTRVGD